MILPGGMRRRATFQTVPVNQDSSGARTGPWTDVVTVWAQVKPLRGQALFEAAKFTHEVDTEFTVRFNKQIKPSQRIKLDDNTIYKILSVVVPYTIKKEMTILTKALPDGEPA